MQFRILGPVEVRGPRGQARLGGAKPVDFEPGLAKVTRESFPDRPPVAHSLRVGRMRRLVTTEIYGQVAELYRAEMNDLAGLLVLRSYIR